MSEHLHWVASPNQVVQECQLHRFLAVGPVSRESRADWPTLAPSVVMVPLVSLPPSRPGYESVQTSRSLYPPSSLHSITTAMQRPAGGTNSPNAPTPPPLGVSGRGTPRLSRVPSTRGSPTQEQLTSNPLMNGSSSPPRTGQSPTGTREGLGRINGDGPGVGRVNGEGVPTMVSRNHSISRSRHSGPTPLTRQQLYRSRNFLHQDLQLPDGYGEWPKSLLSFTLSPTNSNLWLEPK